MTKKKSLIFYLILFSKLEIRNWYEDIGLYKVLNYVRSLTTFLELFCYLVMRVIKQIMLMLMFMSAFFTLNSCLQARVSLVNSVEGIRKGHLFSQKWYING